MRFYQGIINPAISNTRQLTFYQHLYLIVSRVFIEEQSIGILICAGHFIGNCDCEKVEEKARPAWIRSV